MRTRQGETFDWGYGLALPRLLSRPQEGSGEECGRVSELTFFQNRRNSGQQSWNATDAKIIARAGF